MSSELFTITGTTTAAATGYVNLYSDLFSTGTTYDYFRIPKGMKLKVWSKTINHTAAVVYLKYSHDITVGTGAATFITLEVEELDTGVETRINHEKRRPVVVRGFTGTEGIAIYFTDAASAGGTTVSYEVELCCDDN